MNEEKRKIKFNYVDVIIILAVVAVFAFGYRFITKSSVRTSGMPDMIFTFEVTNMEKDYKDNFSVGDEVFDAVKGEALGKIVNVETVPATTVLEDRAEGRFVMGEYEDRESVHITIKGTATSYGTDIMIGKQKIKIGEMVYVKKAGCVGRGYIIKMNVGEAK